MDAKPPQEPVRVGPREAGWLALVGLLLALIVGAALFDRSGWPTLVGDEATYLMQAESLVWDQDLAYSRADFERFLRHWSFQPQGLILQKGPEGGSLVYGKPFFYALWSAPFVRLSPTRGPFVANALLLGLAAMAAARALRRPLGSAAPWWIALTVFASVVFAHVFWAHLDLFLMCLAALGLALVFGAREPVEGGETPADGRARLRGLLRWAAAGLLLAAVAYSRPVYLTLFLPAGLGVWRRERWRGVVGVAAGAAVLFLGVAAVQYGLAGTWTSYGAERRSFNTTTGFPEVDFPADEWDRMIERWGNASWLKGDILAGLSPGTPRLWGWNLVYFFAGESVGLLPYFLPGLLGLVTWRRAPPGAVRWALLAAVALTALGLFLLRPHNFYGGGAALANRYILPIYPALWFLPTRPIRLAWLGVTAALAGPFLWPLWTAPGAYPFDRYGVFRHVSPAARAILPYETTQSHMKSNTRRVDVHHRGLWIRSLTPALQPAGDGRRLIFDPRLGDAALLLGRAEPVGAVHLEVPTSVPPLEIGGGEVLGQTDLGDGRRRLWIELDGPRARHPMWWTRDDFPLYLLRLRAGGPSEAGPVELSVAPAAPAGD